jgi:hypothetical protein
MSLRCSIEFEESQYRGLVFLSRENHASPNYIVSSRSSRHSRTTPSPFFSTYGQEVPPQQSRLHICGRSSHFPSKYSCPRRLRPIEGKRFLHDIFVVDFMAAATASFERWRGCQECEGGEESQCEN